MKDEDQGWGRGAREMIPEAIARILEAGAGLARSATDSPRLALGEGLCHPSAREVYIRVLSSFL